MGGTLQKCAGAGLLFSFFAVSQISPFLMESHEGEVIKLSQAEAVGPQKLSEALNSAAFVKELERQMDILRREQQEAINAHCSGEASQRLCKVVGDSQLHGLRDYGPSRPHNDYNAFRS